MSNKFTGITSAGSAIPVYDKDAHEALSSKLDTSAFSSVSGEFATIDDVVAAVSGKADTSAIPSLDGYLQNTDLTIVDNKITEISGVPLSAGDELPSGVMNTSALEYNAVNEISGYNGSAIAQYGAEKQWLQHDDTLVHAANSAQYALGVNLSAVAQLLGVDETVLWEGTMNATGTTADFLDKVTDFEKIKVYTRRTLNSVGRPFIINEFQPTYSPGQNQAFVYNQVVNIESNQHQEDCMYMVLYGNTNQWCLTGGWRLNGVTQTTGVTTYNFKIEKIVGVHRISG